MTAEEVFGEPLDPVEYVVPPPARGYAEMVRKYSRITLCPFCAEDMQFGWASIPRLDRRFNGNKDRENCIAECNDGAGAGCGATWDMPSIGDVVGAAFRAAWPLYR